MDNEKRLYLEFTGDLIYKVTKDLDIDDALEVLNRVSKRLGVLDGQSITAPIRSWITNYTGSEYCKHSGCPGCQYCGDL